MSLLAESTCIQLPQDPASYYNPQKSSLPVSVPECSINLLEVETGQHKQLAGYLIENCRSQVDSIRDKANNSAHWRSQFLSPEMDSWRTLATYDHSGDMWDCHERGFINGEEAVHNTCSTAVDDPKPGKCGWSLDNGQNGKQISVNSLSQEEEEISCIVKFSVLSDQAEKLPLIDDCILLAQECKNSKQSGGARCLHMHILSAGLESITPALGNHLLQMFIECENFSIAQQLFCRMGFRDESSWTSLMKGYIENGQFEYAFDIFQSMLEDGLFPSRHTFLALLKACTGLKSREKGLKLHFQITLDGFEDDIYVCNSLVVMYVKCGLLSEAQELFGDFKITDAVSWNALIDGYAEQGDSEEALRAFYSMHVAGVSSNEITSLAALKACGDLTAVCKGQEIHADLLKKGYEMDEFVSSSLVDMYAKCGLVADAAIVFDGMCVRGIIIWTALIAGYVDHGFGEEALIYWNSMQSEGVAPNTVAYVFGLKACIKLQALSKGMELHTEIIKKGFERDSFVRNTLTDMYAKCGFIVEAQELLDVSAERDVVSWNILVSGYVEHGLYKEVLEAWDEMQQGTLLPNDSTYVCIMKACGIMGTIENGQEAHMEIIKLGFETHPLVSSTLVDMYAKYALLTEAEHLFSNLDNQDVVSWNALLAGYSEHGHGERALRCIQQMGLAGVFPDTVTFMRSLKACSSLEDVQRGLKLHINIVLTGLDSDCFLGNSLLDMYASCGFFPEAWKVAGDSLVTSVISLNALLAGYCKYGFHEEALISAENVLLQGLLPNAVTNVYILNACGNLKALEKGLSVHAAIVEENMEEDPYVGSALVDMYAKFGFLAEAQGVFDELKVRDVVTWSALIAGYASWGLDEVAKTCLQKMQSENVVPNVISWNAMLSSYSEEGETEEVLLVFAQMQEQGVLPNGVTFLYILNVCGSSTNLKAGQTFHARVCGLRDEANQEDLVIGLIDLYGKCGNMAAAQGVFDDMHIGNFTSWTVLLAGYARQGKSESVAAVLEKMKEESVQPNGVTFSKVLSACSHAGLVDTGLAYFGIMNIKHSITASIEHHIPLIDLFARAGRLDEAVAMVERMPAAADDAVWTALLGACRNWGDVMSGGEVFEFVLEGGNKQDPAFVLRSSLFAQRRSWEEAVDLGSLLTLSFIPEKG